jgi:enoyl-CoA hydratase/carnithine racemase
MAAVVEYRVVESVAEIVMHRGLVNAIDHQLAREVVDAYVRARHDDNVRAVILTSGLPTVFSAGSH